MRWPSRCTLRRVLGIPRAARDRIGHKFVPMTAARCWVATERTATGGASGSFGRLSGFMPRLCFGFNQRLTAPAIGIRSTAVPVLRAFARFSSALRAQSRCFAFGHNGPSEGGRLRHGVRQHVLKFREAIQEFFAPLEDALHAAGRLFLVGGRRRQSFFGRVPRTKSRRRRCSHPFAWGARGSSGNAPIPAVRGSSTYRRGAVLRSGRVLCAARLSRRSGLPLA